jgi:hypothetical protein
MMVEGGNQSGTARYGEVSHQGKRVKWLISGAIIRQHSPAISVTIGYWFWITWVVPANKGGNRLAEIDLARQSVETVFPLTDSADPDFFT